MKIELFKWSVTLHFEDKTNIIMAIRVYRGFQSLYLLPFCLEPSFFFKNRICFAFFFHVVCALAKAPKRIGRAGSFLSRTRIMADAFGELTVAFAQVMGANVASLHLPKSRNAIRMSAVAFPFVRNKVDKRLMAARSCSVAKIVFFATPVDGVDGEPGAEKAAITAVTFVGKWIALRRTAHHVVQVKDIALGTAGAITGRPS